MLSVVKKYRTVSKTWQWINLTLVYKSVRILHLGDRSVGHR